MARVETQTPAEPGVTAEGIVARADAMRPWLLEEQAATEERSFYSEETHAAFKEAGFYRLLVPRRYGGLELGIQTFYKVITSIARSCPSTGWMLSLGVGHALQVASYYPEQAQQEAFRDDGHFVASASFAYQDALAQPVDGGYAVRGTWHYCSGVPHSTHHIGLLPTVSENITLEDLLFVIIPRDRYRVLDNWGDLIGLKGSGSHSIVVEETLIPAHFVIPFLEIENGTGTTEGYRQHGNPMYAGRFMAFAGGELASVQVGNAQGAVDEFERLLPGKREVSIVGSGTLKTESLDYQRCLGQGIAWTDSAYSILMQTAERYEELGRRRVEDGVPITDEDELRVYGQQMTATRLCWEAGDTVFRAASTTGARDGARMQRYWRDLCAFRTNGIHQFDFRSPAIAQARLGLPITSLL